MNIISHRGYWKSSSEKNTSIAFERSFSLRFGTETDIRDLEGDLVISHDIAGKDALTAEAFFSTYKKYDTASLTLALNIKADGLQVLLLQLLEQHGIKNYFVFDMSIPDTMGYIKNGIRFFSRQSEYEMQPAFYPACAGIWLDAFHDTWYSTKVIKDHLQNKKQVALVSPELHGRGHISLWEQLRKDGIHHSDDVILCTDIPEDAGKFFQ